jgi:AmmeMemoRadiSam system protein A
MPPLCSDDRRALLALARAAITEAVLYSRVLDQPPPAGRLAEPASTFVTVHCRGRLRGCVGLTDRKLSLSETVVHCAVGAALHDSRFPAIAAADMAQVEIEVSVLSEFRPVSPCAIETGIHGLLVIQGSHRGLLLPQVAVKRSWPVQRFLEETCRKAGLDVDAWRHPETELLAFTAEVFSDWDYTPAEVGADLRGLQMDHAPEERPAPEKSSSKARRLTRFRRNPQGRFPAGWP